MEILILIVIGLIAKNFKAILEFLAEQGQQYGTPQLPKNSEGQPNLSKKLPTDFSSEEEDYYEEDYYETQPKAYKMKTSRLGLDNQLNQRDYLVRVDNNQSINNQSSNNQSSNNQSSNNQSGNNQKGNAEQNAGEFIIELGDLKKGVIWQEILEPPRARRPYRKII